MIQFLLGLGFGFGLHFAWCKWGKAGGCDSDIKAKLKKLQKRKGKKK